MQLSFGDVVITWIIPVCAKTHISIILNPYHSDVKFSCQENQFITYVHNCLEFVILIKMTANNPEEIPQIKQTRIQIYANLVALGVKKLIFYAIWLI